MLIDPRKVVNSFCTRPVLKRNVQVLMSSIEMHGYQRSNWLTGRIATYPEICLYYQQEPYCYSKEKAKDVANAAMKCEEADGHTYLYDGHLRRIAVLQLLEIGKLAKGFEIPCLLGRHLSDEEEIAYSISCNAINEFSVLLSPLALLMRCLDFDEAVNHERTKRLSASEVAKRMVLFSSADMLAKTAKSKMAETRRQYLSVSRHLSPLTVKFFRELLQTDEAGIERAFNISNMKAIPKNLSSIEQVSLAKRMTKAFETSLPTRKAISAADVSIQVVQIRRASKEVSKFLNKCGYEKIPAELERTVSTMMNTQQFDVELTSNSNLDVLFPPLSEACKNLVPGGTNRLSIAESGQNETTKNGSEANPEMNNDESEYDVLPPTSIPQSSLEAQDLLKKTSNSPDVESGCQSDTPEGTSTSNAHSSTADTEIETVSVSSLFDVHLENLSAAQFSSASEHWVKVEGKVDFVVLSLPDSLIAEESIDKIVKHAGMAMKETGVSQFFCTYVQFGIIHQSVHSNHMHMMPYPMVYVNDAQKQRSKTNVVKMSTEQYPMRGCFLEKL